MLNKPIPADDTSVCVSKVVNAPPERVFAAWTDARHVNNWFGPPGYSAIAKKLDARSGGEYEIAMHPPASEGSESAVNRSIVGRYREVDPPRRLVFTWAWVDASGLPPDDGESLVTVEFLKVADGTEVRITHEQLSAAESREGHLAGWTGSLERLHTLFSLPNA